MPVSCWSWNENSIMGRPKDFGADHPESRVTVSLMGKIIRISPSEHFNALNQDVKSRFAGSENNRPYWQL